MSCCEDACPPKDASQPSEIEKLFQAFAEGDRLFQDHIVSASVDMSFVYLSTTWLGAESPRNFTFVHHPLPNLDLGPSGMFLEVSKGPSGVGFAGEGMDSGWTAFLPCKSYQVSCREVQSPYVGVVIAKSPLLGFCLTTHCTSLHQQRFFRS